MYALNGELIDISIAQVINENQYSPLWLSDETRRSELGIVEVFDTTPPDTTINQVAERVSAEDVEGTWRVVWEVRDLSEEEVAVAAVKLAQDRLDKWEEVKKYRDTLTQTGGYKVNGHWFHSDIFSRTQQLGLVIMGASMPAGIQWKTMDNGFVTMTPTLASQIFQAAALNDIAIFSAAQVHKSAIEISNKPVEYNYGTGWPESFLS